MEWLRGVVRDNSKVENGIAVALAVLLFGAALLLALSLLKAADLLSDAPGWAQAFGSVASIWGTFLVARYQFREQNKRSDEEHAARLEARWSLVRAVAFDCMEALGEARLQAMNEFKKSHFQLRPARLEDCQYALRGLVLQELPAGAVEVILDLQKAVSRTLLDVEKWYEKKATYPLDPDRLEVLTMRVWRAQDDVKRIHGWESYWHGRQKQDPFSSAL